MNKKPGRIITFYSYKGGVGRTMLLINVAWVMASNGMRVLVIDWDLEAPGLHRYLLPFLKDPELTSTRGLLDLLIDFQLEALTPSQDTSQDWYNECADVKKYAIPIEWRFPLDGCLDLLSAGQHGPAYVQRVMSLDWSSFYERFGGGTFLNILKEKVRAEYDYVLIDSRTGVNDIAAICTVQMPDDLVVCTALNSRSIDGAVSITSSVARQRELLSRPLRIFPVPARVEVRQEFEMTQRALASAKQLFRSVTSHLEDEDAYWADVTVPYIAHFASEEIPAAFTGNCQVLEPAARLTAHLTGVNVSSELGMPEDERRTILDEYRGRRSAGDIS